MTAEQQAPIGSGFGMRSTAGDVLAGINLAGWNVICHRRLFRHRHRGACGRWSRRALLSPFPPAAPTTRARNLPASPASRSRSSILPTSPPSRSSHASYVADGHARCTSSSTTRRSWPIRKPASGPNWESQFATNHLGHFALVAGLAPRAQGCAGRARHQRVEHRDTSSRPSCSTTSTSRTRPYQKWQAYGQAKTANSLFAVELDRRGQAAWRPRVRRPPWRHHDAAAALPAEGRNDRRWLDGRRTARSTNASRRRSRALPPPSGAPPRPARAARAASTARIATSRNSPSRAHRATSGVDPHAVDAAAASQPVGCLGRSDRR